MNIAIIGYGKMGKEIEKMALARNHQILWIVDKENSDQLLTRDLNDIDVAIEFSTPESAFFNISNLILNGVPTISGTTGWLDQMQEVTDFVHEKNGAFLYASNFSIGVNLFFKINQYLAKLMEPQKEYSLKISEVHHTEKLDAPSGTAITLADDIIKHSKNYLSWSKDSSKKEQTISILSSRISNVAGTHTVEYASEIDKIEIRHEAHNRRGFALGAIIAAEWIIGRNGLFTMDDVIGFN